jgi:hypothetical protein
LQRREVYILGRHPRERKREREDDVTTDGKERANKRKEVEDSFFVIIMIDRSQEKEARFFLTLR